MAVTSAEFEQRLLGFGASGEAAQTERKSDEEGEEKPLPGRRTVKKGPSRRLSRRERIARKGIERL
jgi:hypothetical protein